MTANVQSLDVARGDVLAEQQAFRQSQRDAIGEALELPIADARARLEQFADDEQQWLAEQRQALREATRQGRSTAHVGEALAGAERELAAEGRWGVVTVSEFPWEHTDRFWGDSVRLDCSVDEANQARRSTD